MGRVAVVLGSNGLGPAGEDLAATAERHGAVVVQRHGGPGGSYTLPHQIDHAANLRRLAERGCDRVLAVGSVGSLRAELAPGTLLCPDDFIALQLGLTTLSDVRAHRMPGFDAGWRDRFLAACLAGGAPPVRDRGVYWQAIGPRFETPAEIRLMAAHADVVGMTIASESIVAGELGLPYAAVCAVDNLANGVDTEPLGIEGLERVRASNVALLHDLLEAALPRLGDG
jgi:5'-methylthioadenosine phosphorylase